jgi:AraC-like DNA-binding protein
MLRGRRCFVVQQRMAGSGHGIFPGPDDYSTQLPGTREFLLVAPAPFHARLTWADLNRLQLLRAQETEARVRYVSLPPDRAFVAFPTHRDTTLICAGIEARPGDVIFHASGERFHERTVAASQWGILSMRVEVLSFFGRTLTGDDIAPPPAGLIIRPKAADRMQLLRLHTRVARTVETRIDMVGHPEVARALEEDLIWALLTCLTVNDREDVTPIELREPLMVRFEEVLAACPDHVPEVAEISDAIGTSESALLACCLRVLGMNPARYLHLRRLTLVQALLTRTGSDTFDLPRQHGFADLHHFVTEYRRAFGSIPAQFQ